MEFDQRLSSKRCQLLNHDQETIQGVCQSDKCNQPIRLACCKCFAQHLKSNYCQMDDIKFGEDLQAKIQDHLSKFDKRYQNAIEYCLIQKYQKIKELEQYHEQWLLQIKKFQYIETIIEKSKLTQEEVNLMNYIEQDNNRKTLEQYINEKMSKFLIIEKFINGHPNYIFDQQVNKLKQNSINPFDCVYSDISIGNTEKIKEKLQMNDDEILNLLAGFKNSNANILNIGQCVMTLVDCSKKDDLQNYDSTQILNSKYQDQYQYEQINKQGKLMRKCGLLDEALNFFIEIIKLYPNNNKAFKYIAKIYETKKQYQEALTYFDQYIKINPNDFKVYQNKAKLLHNNLNNVDEAIQCYDSYMNIDQSNYIAYIEKAKIYQKNHQYQLAIGCFDNYMKIYPKDYKEYEQFIEALSICCDESINLDKYNYLAYMRKAQLLQEKGDFEAALWLYQSYIQFDPNYYIKDDLVQSIVECCDNSINQDQTNINAYLIKAQILQKNNDFISALLIYDQYIQIDPQYHTIDEFFQKIIECCNQYINVNKNYYEPYIRKGILRYQMLAQILQYNNYYKLAFKCYQEYIKINQNYHLLDNLIESILQCCELWIAKDPYNHNLHMMKAQIQTKKQNYEAAFQTYDNFIKLDPKYYEIDDFSQSIIECCDLNINHEKDNYSLYRRKAQILQLKKNYQGAIDCYIEYIKIDLNNLMKDDLFQNVMECCDLFINQDKSNYVAYIMKAQILQYKKNYEGALQIYYQYINIDKNYLKKEKLFQSIIDCYDQYINDNKINNIPYIKKAQLLEQKGDSKSALQCYDLCIQEATNKYDAIFKKGQLLKKQTNTLMDAQKCFEECITIDPTNQLAKNEKDETEKLIKQKCTIF